MIHPWHNCLVSISVSMMPVKFRSWMTGSFDFLLHPVLYSYLDMLVQQDITKYLDHSFLFLVGKGREVSPLC